MGNFAIVRIDKKSSLSQIQRMARHHLRAFPVPNADPQKPIEVIAGPTDAADAVALIRDTVAPLSKRKDSVKCFDVLMTASPDFFKNGGNVDDFKKHAMEWAKKTFTADNIVSAVMHLDETTPHIQLMVLPIHKGKLQAKHWTGTPAKMRILQSTYAMEMAPLGLQRGVMGSEAEHTSIAQWYNELKPRMENAQKLIEEAKSEKENVAAEKDEISVRAAKLDAAGETLAEAQKELVERSSALDERNKQLAAKAAEIEKRDKETSTKEVELNQRESMLNKFLDRLINLQDKLRLIFYRIPKKNQDEIQDSIGETALNHFLGIEKKSQNKPAPAKKITEELEEKKAQVTSRNNIKPKQ